MTNKTYFSKSITDYNIFLERNPTLNAQTEAKDCILKSALCSNKAWIKHGISIDKA